MRGPAPPRHGSGPGEDAGPAGQVGTAPATVKIRIRRLHGWRAIDRIDLDVGRNYGAKGLNFLLTIVLPGALPVIFAGIKLGFGPALVLVVIAEIVASRAGLGS